MDPLNVRWPEFLIGYATAKRLWNRFYRRFATAELAMSGDVVLESVITCPECGHVRIETMPTDACQYFYDCKGCGALLKPKAGDCCVFCSYGSEPCPPIQSVGAGAAGGGCCTP